MKKIIITLAAAALLSANAFAADVKTYQVTGPVTEITPTTITVMKGKEKWQILRGSAAVPADVKEGSKVTVQYTMTATAVDAKSTKSK